MPELSAFKNYKAGDPTCRLYIKNLAKTVDEKVAFKRKLFYTSNEEFSGLQMRLGLNLNVVSVCAIRLPNQITSTVLPEEN